MSNKTNKIILSKCDVYTHGTTVNGIRLKVFGNTNRGKGKRHEIIIDVDLFYLQEIVKVAKESAREKRDYAQKLLNRLNEPIV